MFDTPSDTPSAFARYEAVRERLPVACFPASSLHMAHLGEVADHYDGFVLDAFGVLNVGQTAIPGAVTRMADLRRRGKSLCVLSNAASYTRAGVLAKYERLGFDFRSHEVVTSRDVAAARMNAIAPGAIWAAISDKDDDYFDIPEKVLDAVADPQALHTADAILFLATQRLTPELHAMLIDAVIRNPRPVVVANPDLVAPLEVGLSREPGLFSHDLIDRTGIQIHWFGKPFGDGFADILSRVSLPADRLAMVGDTLHTDVLGGCAAGMGTVLVTDHGMFRGYDTAPFISQSGIIPDIIVPTT